MRLVTEWLCNLLTTHGNLDCITLMFSVKCSDDRFFVIQNFIFCNKNFKLTIEDGEEIAVIKQPVEHFEIDFLDFISQFPVYVLDHPLEDVILDHQVAVEEQRVAVSEVDQCRVGFDGVPLCHCAVVDFDHLDAVGIAIVVDVLQLLQDFVARPAVWFI